MLKKFKKIQFSAVIALVLLAPGLVSGIVNAENLGFPITNPVTSPVTPPTTPSPTPTVTILPTPTPSATPSASPSVTPTATPAPTVTPKPTVTPTPTPTVTPTPVPLTIKVTSPNGGEYLVKGSVFPIKWTSSTSVAYVDILVKDNLGNIKWIVTGLGNPKAFKWTVNTTGLSGNMFKIRLIAYNTNRSRLAIDESDKYFTIRLSTPTPSPFPTKPPIYIGPPVVGN